MEENREIHVSAKGYTGYDKARPTLGPMRERAEIVQPLPPIGSYISIYERIFYSRDIFQSTEKGESVRRRDFLTPAAGCSTADGIEKVFRVTSYSRGIDNPFAINNHVYLQTVYPERAASIGGVTTFPARQIAAGVLCIKYRTGVPEGGE